MNMQIAELAPEREMLLWGDVLIAKKMTRFSASARWISSMVRFESGLARSTPDITAPMIGVSFSTSMVS